MAHDARPAPGVEEEAQVRVFVEADGGQLEEVAREHLRLGIALGFRLGLGCRGRLRLRLRLRIGLGLGLGLG